ncbi:MAG TPA: CHAT domain-containing protein [Chitinophagaceae bacterium]|jgi:CHAT domain-containing protein|nr:CHAT domain-containing protein [Chitinophagaceae bacterium]
MKFQIIKSFLFIISLAVASPLFSQTQEDFQNKFNDIYLLQDKSKALTQAKELFQLVEKNKLLQTYANYYLLKTLFEGQAADASLAKTCAEKADKISREQVGLEQPDADYGSDSSNLWFKKLFPALYETTDPDNADKALKFLDQHISFQSYANYTGVAYAYERNGDYKKAKQYYEYCLTMVKDDKTEYASYLYYILFLARSGEYQLAEEMIRHIEALSTSAIEMLRMGYHNEALSARTLFYYFTGDNESYVKASQLQFAELGKLFASYKMPCTGENYVRFTNEAVAIENLKDYNKAEEVWKSRDTAYNAWLKCQRELYPNNKLYELDMLPVFLMKRGKANKLTHPASFYIKQTETYYNSFVKYQDAPIKYSKALMLAFLGAKNYDTLFEPIIDRIKKVHDFTASTKPLADFAYLSMHDRKWDLSIQSYKDLFSLNTGWINDIIFSFGEKPFVTYYNSKLKEGYDNFQSFVKLAKDSKSSFFPQLSVLAYNNLLFTKSISLQGTKKRKEAFLKSNSPSIVSLYDEWLDRKQQLIRMYFKTSEPAGASNRDTISTEKLKQLQRDVSDMENKLTTESKDFKKLLTIIPPDWKEVKSKLKADEAAIEITRFQWRDQVYYSDTSYYAAFLITANSEYPEVIYFNDKPKDLEDKFYKQYKNSIRLKVTDNDSYNHFWKPIAEKLSGISKVYVSPDGIFHLINFATLKNPITGNYVLDELQVQLTTSTHDIASVSDVSNPQHVKTAVLFGRPSYFISTDSLTAALPGGTTRAFVNNFKPDNVTDLPGTEVEVMDIKAALDKSKYKTIIYLKEMASEDKIYKLHQPYILHIATHGFWSESGTKATSGFRLFNAMANSGLLFTGVVNYYNAPQFADTYDGVLTAYEAQNIDLTNTELVVLSACETTLGYLDAGEGVYGLQRAFRVAGASSIMTSLWKVDDKATQDFMTTFYQQFLLTGDKYAAFFQAQKTIKDKYKDPYYWGAFVMTGQ